MKKIVHISHLYPSEKAPYLGSFMKELHDSLLDLCDIDFIIPTPFFIPYTKRYAINSSPLISDRKKASRINYFSIPRKKMPLLTKLSLSRNIIPIIKEGGYSLIHIHWSFPELLILPEIKKIGFPVVNTLHGQSFYETLNNTSLKKYLEQGLFLSDLTFTVGNRLREDVIREFPFMANKCINLPNGIDELKFFIGNKEQARDKLNWDQFGKHILCVAHITKEKGLESLLESFLKLKTTEKTYLHIIGRPFDPILTKKILEAAKKSNIIYYGALPHSELPLYYHASDLFVLPSLIEGFGVALVEAGMSGLPLLSTFSGGPEDIITPTSGILVEPDNPKELGEKIEFLLRNLPLFSPMDIRESMISRFSKKKIASQLHQYYLNILKPANV